MQAKITDIMRPGDWFIHQTKHGNWVLGQASKVEENGDITCCLFDRETGREAQMYNTLKQAVDVALKQGMRRTWKLGYHRWKVETV